MEPAPATITGFAAERTLLQQELIRLRAQRDRQIDQLTRANHLSDTLARTHDEEPVAALFAEAVLDVLDVAVGAAWIVDDPDAAGHEFAVVGVQTPDAWAGEGRRIADALRDAGVRTAVAADRLGITLPEGDLADVLVSPILNRAGTCAGILLAAGSARAGGMSEPIAEETRSMLSVLAEKLAAHLDGRDDRRLIREQMARLRDSEAHVRHLAFYDALTDLPNRRLLADRVQQARLADLRRGTRSALILLDLDRFKLVNDLYGHAVGDQLLGAVAGRLRSVVRAHDTVARLSGDEFVVLLEDVGGDLAEAEANATMVATKILDALRSPFGPDAGMSPRGASLGVTIIDDHAPTVDALIERADVAMYEAKAGGRNRWCLFRAEMQTRVNERVALELRLQQALDAREVFVEYQAQVDSAGGLVGAEALMRWQPDHGGRIPPDAFIPVAEESGLILPLGRQLLDEVCRQARRWSASAPAGFRLSCNLSAPEILDGGFVERVIDTLDAHGLPGSVIRFEITEATALRELDAVAERIGALREHGVEFSLDDFGTGYSSLTYLRRLPVSELKIDRSYVQRLLEDAHDGAIARAIVALGDAFGLRVVAEGVETAEQMDALLGIGCRTFQGYWFGLPVLPPHDPDALLTDRRRAALA